MSSVNVNLPKSLHREISQFAEREGISLSQFIAAAAAEIAGYLLSAGAGRFHGEISRGCGHHQVAAVVEDHRHH